MGIKGLESYIRKNLGENVIENIDIREEITKWQEERQTGTKPTIIIILKDHTINTLLANIDQGQDTAILGGRYAIYNEKIKYFLDELKKSANLVFFLRPMLNQPDEYKMQKAFDLVLKDSNERQRFYDNAMTTGRKCPPWHLDSRFLYNLVKICAKYGPINTRCSYSQWSSEMRQYAREHSNEVIAMIQYDTDFILDGGDYQYWSLIDLNIYELKTTRYRRDTLCQHLQLNTKQCQMLSALSRLKDDLCDTFRALTNGPGDVRIFRMADYVRNMDIGPDGYDLKQITENVFGIENYRQDYEDRLKKELIRYRNDIASEIESKISPNQRAFARFCQENLYYGYRLLVEDSTIIDACKFIDLRENSASRYVDSLSNIQLKLLGILFYDYGPEARPEKRTMIIKREKYDKFTEINENIIYPPMQLPSIHELIMNEDDTSLDAARWTLLQWVLGIDADAIQNIQSSSKDSQYIRIVEYTLTFLRLNHHITIDEDVIIRRTELNGQRKNNAYKPRSFCPPPSMPAWRDPGFVRRQGIRTVHKYTVAFEAVCHCLEICGLRKETELIQFDAFEFHENLWHT